MGRRSAKRRSATVGPLLVAAGIAEKPSRRGRPSIRFALPVPDNASLSDEALSISSSDDASAQASSGDTSNHSSRLVCRTTWKVMLGLTALMDCIATVLPSRLTIVDNSTMCNSRRRAKEAICSTLGKLDLFGERTVRDARILEGIQWLDRNAVYFSFAFSILWCIQAFRDARYRREQAMRHRDRKRLLHRGESVKSLSAEDDLVKSGYFDGWGPWLAYYATLLLQLLLVPVGFYIWLYQGIQLALTGKISNLEEATQLIDTSREGQNQTLHALLDQVIDASLHDQAYTKDAKLSVIMLILKHVGNTIYLLVGTKIKSWLVKKGWQEGRKLGFNVIVHPRRVWKKARKLIRGIRWAKYLAPLIATANKLRENVQDLLKKRRQRKEAVVAIKIRKLLWGKMTEDERRQKAARSIQSFYRSYQHRKATWALALLQCHHEELAAIRVQTMLRKMLHRARARIRKKRLELKELEARERQAVRRDGRMTMSPAERKRLYQLQDEMKGSKKGDSIDKRLLLRPNTRFALTWKIVFVFCVLIEITELAVTPLLAKHKDKATGKPSTCALKVQSVLIPESIATRKECSCTFRDLRELDSWDLMMMRARPPQCSSDPWYCLPPVAAVQSYYAVFMRFVLENFLRIVSVIVFLDVPIYFYTGELCGETGTLIPKGFFDRWIAPGLLMQLVVNPEMETVSKTVWSTLVVSLQTGMIRVWRWVDALLHPLMLLLLSLLEYNFWIPAVASANRDQILPAESITEEAPASVRRRATMMRRTTVAIPTDVLVKPGHRRASFLELRKRRASYMPITEPRRSSVCGRNSISSHEREKLKML